MYSEGSGNGSILAKSKARALLCRTMCVSYIRIHEYSLNITEKKYCYGKKFFECFFGDFQRVCCNNLLWLVFLPGFCHHYWRRGKSMGPPPWFLEVCLALSPPLAKAARICIWRFLWPRKPETEQLQRLPWPSSWASFFCSSSTADFPLFFLPFFSERKGQVVKSARSRMHFSSCLLVHLSSSSSGTKLYTLKEVEVQELIEAKSKAEGK